MYRLNKKDKFWLWIVGIGAVVIWVTASYTAIQHAVREYDHQISTEAKLDRLLEIAEDFDD